MLRRLSTLTSAASLLLCAATVLHGGAGTTLAFAAGKNWTRVDRKLGLSLLAIAATVFVPVVLLVSLLVWLDARKRQREGAREASLCPACGYDLRATPGRCPECGTVPQARLGP